MVDPIHFARVYMQTGTHFKQVSGLKGRDLLSPSSVVATAPKFWAIIIANQDPKRPVRWLDVSATYLTRASGKVPDPIDFTRDKPKPGMLAAELTPDSELTLTIQVFTDHPDYRAVVERARATRGAIRHEVIVNTAAQIGGKRIEDQIAIQVALNNVEAMPVYRGFVALDLGNTSSTLVYRARGLNVGPEIRLVQTRETAVGPAEPATSALRIKSIRLPTAAAPANYKACDCLIGQDALEGDPPVDSLFLGAKRLLSDHAGPGEPQTLDFLHEGQRIEIGRTEPAELFIAKMLEAFYRQERSYPERLVLTCPTTFSRLEVEKIKVAAYHGARRSRGVEPRSKAPTDEELKRTVPWVIDEASAAAFYFVHDEFLEKDGRVAGFRYIYPEGMNLLLFDCGGGTTDIALVHVKADEVEVDNVGQAIDQPEAPRAKKFVVDFKVKGRAGHRNFAGDAMTMAVYRLLKLKLARLMAVEGSLDWPQADDKKALLQFFADGSRMAQVDKILRTAFDAEEDDPSLPETRDRKKATLLLWKAAEELKRKLATAAAKKEAKGQARVAFRDANENLGVAHLQEVRKMAGTAASVPEDFTERAQELTISTAEVDALIEAETRESVRYARSLIEARLGRGQEVNWVFVVGNASRWPLLRRVMFDPEYGLPVRFLAERLRSVRGADLKNSVAKGALRVMEIRDRFQDYSVNFDEELMERLPFDIQRKGALPLERVLFQENDCYDDLKPREIAIATPTREIVLSRVWPGDVKGEDYLSFHCPGSTPLFGKYRIEYDRHQHGFKMRAVDEDGEPKGEPIPGVPQGINFRNAPVQVGELAWLPVKA